MSTLVIVESPAKAKTVGKYLGAGYDVLASFGHVRDLPSKKGSIDVDKNFEMLWQETENARKSLPPILRAAKKAQKIYLATDPDREGEAISWHVREILKQHLGKKFDELDVARITFHEITKKAITDALEKKRGKLNENLVDAYRTRRALDYLVGFSVSPLLWRKLPGARSAGRVQSVALRMICERQAEIEKFQAKEFWSIEVQAKSENGFLKAALVKFDGKKLGKMEIDSKQRAEEIKASLLKASYLVKSIKPSQAQRHPAPPFITSTLQQEASNKLGFSPARTMRIAQKLYEGLSVRGSPTALITYMRTDSFTIAAQALEQARAQIGKMFEKSYLPDKPRFYKNKSRSAQEAHEAIRPINFATTPESLTPFLDSDQQRLYQLIWRRALASQMTSAVIDKLAIEIEGANGEGANGGIASGDSNIGLRALSSRILFDGFLKLYRDTSADEQHEDEAGSLLPSLQEGEKIEVKEIDATRHETQPPPHFSEARLIRELEQAGIGRPSTYAAIINVLKVRGYVLLEKRKMIPQDAGRMATSFLCHNFKKYVDYDFTASLEEQLDKIACGDGEWQLALQNFWDEFKTTLEQGAALSPEQVRAQLEEDLAYYYFPKLEDGSPSVRSCPTCEQGHLEIHPGRHGAFIGCSSYPDCRYTRGLADGLAQEEGISGITFPHTLGICPETDLQINLRRGPYGVYIQRGEVLDKKEQKKKPKPKRVALPKHFDPKTITLQSACQLLALPREIGEHPQTGKEVKAGIGRFGPFLLHDGAYTGLGEQDDVMSIGINRAVVVIAEGGSDGRVLGSHPQDAKPVVVKNGRFGFYIKHDGINASLPRVLDPEEISLEEALEVLAKKIAKVAKVKATAGVKKPLARKTKKMAAKNVVKKAATKKKVAKKAVAKKAVAKSVVKKVATKKVVTKKAVAKKAATKKVVTKKAVVKKAATKKAVARKSK